jgi:hypothetical protein
LSTHPQIPRGSDADVAEAGLDVEASFAEVDAQTSRRMSMEAASQKHGGIDGDVEGGLPGSMPEGTASGKAPTSLPHEGNLPRGPNGPSAMDMLTSPVEGGMQDAPNLSEDRWDASQGLMTEDALETSPNQEGPPGTAHDGDGRG